MRVKTVRTTLCVATAGLVVAALAAAPTATAGRPDRASPANHVASTAKVTNQHVIVLLRDQHLGSQPRLGGSRSTARTRAIAADQSSVVNTARQLGATNIHQYSLINAVTATIKSSQVDALSRSANVASVVPDLTIRGPVATRDSGGAKSPQAQANAIPAASYCSTKSAQPRLEPEALQTMHVDYDDPTTPSAAQFEDGAGVKVAWIADGIDINNPDFIRPGGQHVFVDYKDFSGDGLSAPTGAAEAFGDASAIAAQGLQTYDVNKYAAAANKPGHCYITVRGVAPGASLVGLKVFGNSNSAPTSHFISAIQYAVDTAHVDVLNESFGANPYPDTMNDPVSLVNNAAIAAGVTVVSSTGDAGTNGTTGSPATSRGVIGVAGTTNFRTAAQLNTDGLSNPALNVTGWANDNISSLSSGGYALNGKVPDVAAPGNNAWALCTPNLKLYEECSDEDGVKAVSIQDFGGTSQSSPLTAGTAALVIGAYRKAHDGASPSPALVKSIIVGTAQDLGHPAFEQGSGEVDALAAVRAALSIPAPGHSAVPATATGAQLVTSTDTAGVNQLDISGNAGDTVTRTFNVRNAGAGPQTVNLSTRALTKVMSRQTGNVRLDPTQTFPNVQGNARAYKIIDVPVKPGADRLDASIAFPGDQFGAIVFLALVDPFGNFQAYSAPQGLANFAHVDARYPAPGTWHAMVWANPVFTGNINYEFEASKFTSYGKVSPASLTIAPGQSKKVSATFPIQHNAGDMSAAVVLKTARGGDQSMPVSIRSLLPNTANGTFTGVLTGGNGRQTDALSMSYYLNVPKHKAAVSVSTVLDRTQYPNELFASELVAPNGMTYSARTNVIVNGHGNLDVGRRVVSYVRAPQAGRWRYILIGFTPSGGDVVNQPFTGKVKYNAADISAKALPKKSTKLAKGKSAKYRVVIKNNSAMQQVYFADPRLSRQATYNLASQVPDNDLQHLSLPNPEDTPNWLVPTEATSLNFRADASMPIGLDTFWQYGDPETFGGPAGNSAQVTVAATPSVANGNWSSDIGEQGPFDGPAPSGTVAANLLATMSAFDFDADTSTGDFWFTSLIPATGSDAGTASGAVALGTHGRYLNALRHQSRVTPVPSHRAGATKGCGKGLVILSVGESCAITLTITPAATKGSTVHGHLSVQSLDPFGATTSDLVSLPYAYTVK